MDNLKLKDTRQLGLKSVGHETLQNITLVNCQIHPIVKEQIYSFKPVKIIEVHRLKVNII